MTKHRTICPSCNKVFKVTLEMQGRRCQCAGCKTKFVVNIETPLEDVFEDVVEVQTTQTPDNKILSANSTGAVQDDEVVEVIQTPTKDSARKTSKMSVAHQAQAIPTLQSNKASPFEELASKLVSAHQSANENLVYDPTKFMAYSTNADLNSKDFAGERATKMIIRGGALMLFSMMLMPLVLFGIHLSGSSLTCPLGGLLASALGCLGALLAAFGLRAKLPAAALVGGLPGLGFLTSGGLVIFLFLNGYWGSTSSSSRWNSGRTWDIKSRSWDQADDQQSNDDDFDAFLETDKPSDNNSFDSLRNNLEQEINRSKPKIEQKPSTHNQRYSATPLTQIEGSVQVLDDNHTNRHLIRERQRQIQIGKNDFVGTASYDVRSPDSVHRKYYRLDPPHPMLGFDAALNHQDNFGSIVPVFFRDEKHVCIAKPGYSVGKLNVFVKDRSVRGIQCVFMKLDNNRLDPAAQYIGEWIGFKPGPNQARQIDGQGNIVSGIWTDQVVSVSALGLILEVE